MDYRNRLNISENGTFLIILFIVIFTATGFITLLLAGVRYSLNNVAGYVASTYVSSSLAGFCNYEYIIKNSIRTCSVYIKNYNYLHNATLANENLNDICPIGSYHKLYYSENDDDDADICYFTNIYKNEQFILFIVGGISLSFVFITICLIIINETYGLKKLSTIKLNPCSNGCIECDCKITCCPSSIPTQQIVEYGNV